VDLLVASNLLRLLSDSTRVRLLALLEREELTVAELSAILRLAQPRVSTHLAKLKEANLVRDRRAGVLAYYRLNTEPDQTQYTLLDALRNTIIDPLINEDAQRLPEILANRARVANWADSVAGDMERHYSPGRTWETVARAMTQLLELGDVLDIASGDGVLAELLAPQARSIVCIDTSNRVVNAARERLKEYKNVEVRQGDMHQLELESQTFDLALLMHALTYSEKPSQAIAEASRALKPGGRLLICTLARHAHKTTVEPFDHRNLGFKPQELRSFVEKCNLKVVHCEKITHERRSPHFEVIMLLARKPSEKHL